MCWDCQLFKNGGKLENQAGAITCPKGLKFLLTIFYMPLKIWENKNEFLLR